MHIDSSAGDQLTPNGTCCLWLNSDSILTQGTSLVNTQKLIEQKQYQLCWG